MLIKLKDAEKVSAVARVAEEEEEKTQE